MTRTSRTDALWEVERDADGVVLRWRVPFGKVALNLSLELEAELDAAKAENADLIHDIERETTRNSELLECIVELTKEICALKFELLSTQTGVTHTHLDAAKADKPC